jgi:hypothetical protein
MRLRFCALGSFGFYAALAFYCSADAQTIGGSACPYIDGPPAATCTPNHNSKAIPSAYKGDLMQPPACADVLSQALASLYSYDDASCRQLDSNIGSDLKFIGDIKGKLAYFSHKRAEDEHLEGDLFCDTRDNILVIAFRGSVGFGNVSGKGWYQDWKTNGMATYLHELPLQFEYAYDAVDRVKEVWAEGRFDGHCGAKPQLLLTGHSKGGAEAQLAAIGLELKAVVFNSLLIEPSIFRNVPLPGDSHISSQSIDCSPRVNSNIERYYRSGKAFIALAVGLFKVGRIEGAIRDEG